MYLKKVRCLLKTSLNILSSLMSLTYYDMYNILLYMIHICKLYDPHCSHIKRYFTYYIIVKFIESSINNQTATLTTTFHKLLIEFTSL